MEKRKSCDASVKLPRKIRALSGYNLYHAECMQSQESKNCSSLAEKNIYSSTQWKSLSAEDKTKYNEKAASMDGNSRSLSHEITKLLNRLQELAEYANGLPGLELFFVSVHGGSHVVGGTTPGCSFLQNIAPYIPHTFIGYLSSLSGITTPMQSLPRDCAPLEDSDSKNELRRAVESLFNSLYGNYTGKTSSKLPYGKINEYGISIDGLPPEITLKHPSYYGKATMRKILSSKDLLKLNVANGPLSTQGEEQGDKRLTGNKSISDHMYSSHQQTTEVQRTTEVRQTTEVQQTKEVRQTTEVQQTKEVQRTTEVRQTTEVQQTAVVKPKPGQNVNIISTNSRVVGTGKVMEGNMLHGHEIPDSFVKISIQKIDSNIPPLLKSTFDEPYLTAGVFTAWPAHQLQCATLD